MMTNFEHLLLERCTGKPFSGSPDDLTAVLQAAMSIAEVAEKLGLSVRQVQAHVDDGSLVAVNLGRGGIRKDLRVLDSDLQGFLVRRRTAARKAVSFQEAAEPRPTPLPPRPKFSEVRAARKAREGR